MMIAIGIDLGTTNSVCVFCTSTGKKIVILHDDGKNTLPSAVCFKGETPVVGTSAKRQAVLYPDETCLSIKRLIGKKDSLGRPVTVTLKGKEYKPEVISSMILKAAKKAAEKHLNEVVDAAVITVPAYFESDEREATKLAGEIAGLKVLRVMNEPTAAALAYGMANKTDKPQNILVYDLGGGTFDVTALCLDGEVGEVKATNGNRNLGGDDFDSAIVDWIAETFAAENNLNVSQVVQNNISKQRMREAAEVAKIELSNVIETTISLPMLYHDEKTGIGYNFHSILTRAKFNFLTKKLVESTRKPTLDALADAGWKPGDVDEIVMVGGSIRIPAVQELVTSIFSGKKLNFSINPDEVVAEGAGIQAAILSGSMNASEQGGLVLLDVLPLSLGIEEHGKTMSVILPRNTTIPTEKTEVYSTVFDNQPAVNIKVYQGERVLAADNKLLGEFVVNISPAPRGVPEIAVKFDVDANGILSVSATDKKTGKTEKIRIEKQTLSKEEIAAAIEESRLNEAKDREIKLLVERKSRIEVLMYEIQSSKESVAVEKHDELQAMYNQLNELMTSESELKSLTDAELDKKYIEITKLVLKLKEEFPATKSDSSASESSNSEEAAANNSESQSSSSTEEEVQVN